MVTAMGSGVLAIGEEITPYDSMPVYAQMNWSYVFRSPNLYKNISTYYSAGHIGLDLPAPAGTPIYATTGGTVIKADFNSSMGNNVVLRTNSSDSYGYLMTRNMHMLNQPSVTVNQTVTANTIIGYVGNTGDSYGNHLHYDVNNLGIWDGGTLNNNFLRTINPTWLFTSIAFTVTNSEQASECNSNPVFENDYYSIDRPLMDLVGEGRFQTFIDAYAGTAEFNVLKFIEFFNIEKSDFGNAYNGAMYPLHDSDVVYSGDISIINGYYNF